MPRSTTHRILMCVLTVGLVVPIATAAAGQTNRADALDLETLDRPRRLRS